MAAAFGHKGDEIHIWNASWGSGDALEDLGPLGNAAVESAITNGRGGKGRIFVRAAGNSGDRGDNCNFDGFANNRFVIAVGALNDSGYPASYSEPCSALFVTAPSGGEYGRRGIITTDLVGTAGYDPSDYTSSFGGTSAAAPLVSGVAALMLAVNPMLTWRDVQYILAMSAIKLSTDSDWTKGSFAHSEKYGFGLVDAQAAVRRAATWTGVPPETALPPITHAIGQTIPDNTYTGISDTITVDDAFANLRVEHVEVVFDATHPRRGDLEITLTSPAGRGEPARAGSRLG